MICNTCKRDLPLDCFYKDKKSSTGHQRKCKECTDKQVKKYQLLHPKEKKVKQIRTCPICGKELEKYKHLCNDCLLGRKQQKSYYEMSDEQRKVVLEKNRLYRENNPDKLEKYRIQQRAWHELNPIKYWAQHAISAKRRDSRFIVTLTSEELEQKAASVEYCPICGVKIDYSRKGKGHALPNSPSLDRINNENEVRNDNTQILCYKCNATKSNRTMKEFIEYCSNVVKRFPTYIHYN